MSQSAEEPIGEMPIKTPPRKQFEKLESATKLTFRSWLWLQHHEDTEFATLARLVLGGGPEGIWANKPLKAVAVAYDISQFFASGRSGITEDHVRMAEDAKEAYFKDERSVDDLVKQRTREENLSAKQIDVAARDAIQEELGDIEVATIRNGYPRLGEGGIVRVTCSYVSSRERHCTRVAVIGSDRCDLHGGAYLEPEEIKSLIERGQERLIAASDAALDTVLDLMKNSVQDPVRLKAAEMILDRAGFRPGVELTIGQAGPAAAKTPIQELEERLSRLSGPPAIVNQDGKAIE